jgi:hypothetical protein
MSNCSLPIAMSNRSSPTTSGTVAFPVAEIWGSLRRMFDKWQAMVADESPMVYRQASGSYVTTPNQWRNILSGRCIWANINRDIANVPRLQLTFSRQMSCHFSQLTPWRGTCIPSVSGSTTVEKKEPKTITALPKFRGIVPYISPTVLTSIRSMSDNDLIELLNDVGKWHLVGEHLERRGPQVIPQILPLRSKEPPKPPEA